MNKKDLIKLFESLDERGQELVAAEMEGYIISNLEH